MSEDRVIGVAVLDTEDPIHWLHYLKVGRNIEGVSWDSLPMLPEGAARPPDALPSCFPENNPWRYRLDGETIHVAPSVNQGDGFWHNDGQWSVKFVRAESGGDDLCRRQLARVNSEEDTVRLRAIFQ